MRDGTNTFTPPGHETMANVLGKALSHLNPSMTDADFTELSEADGNAKLMECLHFLRGLLFEGKLIALYVSPFGGGLSPISNDFWLKDEADQALAFNEYWPFGQTPMFREERPRSAMYAKAGEIEAVLKALTEGEPGEPEQLASAEPVPSTDALPAYVSPYIRIMLDISRKLDISPTNQPKLDVIIAEIESRWGELPQSKRLLEAMATMVRSPESQGGRRKPE